MYMHNDDAIFIAFGTAKEKFIPADFHRITQPLHDHMPFAQLKGHIPVEQIIFLHQTHSIKGIAIKKANIPSPFAIEGDFVSTNIPGIVLGVATADCLPILFFDRTHNAIAAIHAGWRGSVENIALKALRHMHNAYGTQTHDLEIYFGPSAKSCCYEVGTDFVKNMNPDMHDFLEKKDHKLYCNIPALNAHILQGAGILKQAFNYTYHYCTICKPGYCSYRKTQNSERQFSLICLQK